MYVNNKLCANITYIKKRGTVVQDIYRFFTFDAYNSIVGKKYIKLRFIGSTNTIIVG